MIFNIDVDFIFIIQLLLMLIFYLEKHFFLFCYVKLNYVLVINTLNLCTGINKRKSFMICSFYCVLLDVNLITKPLSIISLYLNYLQLIILLLIMLYNIIVCIIQCNHNNTTVLIVYKLLLICIFIKFVILNSKLLFYTNLILY